MRTRIRSAINNYPPRWLSILTMNEKIFHASTSVTPLMKTKLRSTCYCYELFWWRKSFEIECEFEPSDSEKENVRDSQNESVVKENWSEVVGSHIFGFSNRNKSIQNHKQKKKKKLRCTFTRSVRGREVTGVGSVASPELVRNGRRKWWCWIRDSQFSNAKYFFGQKNKNCIDNSNR